MDKIKAKIEELKKFIPQMYSFGLKLVNDHSISEREDRENILEYFRELSFIGVSEEQKEYIEEVVFNYRVLRNQDYKEREDYLDKIKFIVNYILTSNNFSSNKKRQNNKKRKSNIIKLMTNQYLLKDSEYEELITYIGTLSDEELEYFINKSLGDCNCINFSNIKKLMSLPENEREAVYYTIGLTEGYALKSGIRFYKKDGNFYFSNSGGKGKSVYMPEEFKKSNEKIEEIIDFVINAPKKERWKLYYVLESNPSTFLWCTNYMEIFESILAINDEKRNLSYFIIAGLIEELPVIGNSPEIKEYITQEILKTTKFLLETSEDRFEIAFEAAKKVKFHNKYKISRIMTNFNAQEQQEIFHIAVNKHNQEKSEDELIGRLCRELEENTSYELANNMVLKHKQKTTGSNNY